MYITFIFRSTHNEVVLKGLRKDRFNVVCFICGIKYGACVQCDFHNCPISFHVTCGQRNVKNHNSHQNQTIFFYRD